MEQGGAGGGNGGENIFMRLKEGLGEEVKRGEDGLLIGGESKDGERDGE